MADQHCPFALPAALFGSTVRGTDKISEKLQQSIKLNFLWKKSLQIKLLGYSNTKCCGGCKESMV